MDWITFAAQWGLPGVMIVGAGFFIWKISPWVGQKIDLLINTHIDFVKNTDARLGNVEDKITNLDDIATRQTSILEKMEENHTIMMANQRTMLTNQTSIVHILERYKTNGKVKSDPST